MVKRRGPPGQGWKTFLRNHAPDIAAMDLFVVPTIGFKLLYAFVVVRLDRRDLVWIDVTANPTAEWVARQITEAFPWNEAPRYKTVSLPYQRRSPIELRRTAAFRARSPISRSGRFSGVH